MPVEKRPYFAIAQDPPDWPTVIASLEFLRLVRE